MRKLTLAFACLSLALPLAAQTQPPSLTDEDLTLHDHGDVEGNTDAREADASDADAPASRRSFLSGSRRAASANEQGAPAPAPRTEKTDFLFVWDEAAKKLTDLAAAIPSEKYAWRPAEGVRSVGEVVAHIASGVYYLTLSMRVTPPAGHPQSFEEAGALEKMPGKAEATAALAKALAYARQAAEGATPELLAKEVDFFGQKVNGRTLFLMLEGHCQEHLGQLIAYARMNGVMPPWSR